MTMTQPPRFTSRFSDNRRTHQMRKLLGATLLVAVAACKASDLNINNPNSPTVQGASADPTALQLFASGLMAEQRATRTGFITNASVFGRESYTFAPQEGRNVTHPLLGITIGGVTKIDPSGFASGPWSSEYNLDRDIFNFKNNIAAITTLSAAQKAAALGFAQTLEAQMIFEIVQTHDTLGAIVEVKADPTQLAPFVSRDSAYKFIIGTLDAAAANLAAGGSAFPFTLHSGYTGFNTPSSFAQFNRALKAKVEINYATSGGGTAAWQAALTALSSSFLNASATTRSAFDAGVYFPYGASPDSPNGLTQVTNTNLYAHMSFQSDAQLKADGKTLDDRYTAKIRTGLPLRQGPVTADGPTTGSSTLGFSIWPALTTPIALLRNEELILIRAEARLATGDKAGAITDLNQVRQNSGGLPASTLTAASSNDDILTGILYEKRYSTMMEGNRWIDMRRYGRLNQLPLDVASGPNKNFVAKVNPVPQGECLVRAGLTGDLVGPGGLNDCQ
jgi:starch-binding outer membrane protein, SusD/RagB family